MAFENFFATLSQTASNSSFQSVFSASAQTLPMSINLNILSAEAQSIITWVRYRQNEPRLPSEIDNLQIFAAFEESNMEYSAIVNQFQAKNWIDNYLGMDRNINVTDKLPQETMDYLMRSTAQYGTEAGAGGFQNMRRAYVTINSTSMDYSLLNNFTDELSGSSIGSYLQSVSSARIEVRKVWHSEPSSLYRFYDPYSSVNTLSQEFQYESMNMETIFYIMPIWTDILRAGMLETNDRVRRSNHTYNIYGDRIRLLPKPSKNLKIWIEYTFYDYNPLNADYSTTGGDPSISGVTNITNVPFTDITYDKINAFGRRWIRQYTLALSNEMLGKIRRRFSSIPIPNGDITMDGEQLVSEALTRQTELREELKAGLEETSDIEIYKRNAEMAEAISRQMQFIPFAGGGIYIMG